MMARKLISLTGLLIICFLVPWLAHTRGASDLPDLRITQFEFVSTNDKGLRVHVVNDGKVASKPCRLELAVRKIKGVAVTRTASETIPAIDPRKGEWVTLTASGILPAAISLKDTTFRLTVDETGIVAESDEDNNEIWHNVN